MNHQDLFRLMLASIRALKSAKNSPTSGRWNGECQGTKVVLILFGGFPPSELGYIDSAMQRLSMFVEPGTYMETEYTMAKNALERLYDQHCQ